jgi:valyl-tRNA synthetase
MTILQELIVTVRAKRKELGVPEKELTPIRIDGLRPIKRAADQNRDILTKLVRANTIEIVQPGSPALSGQNVAISREFEVQVVYERQIDIPAECERLTKDLAKYEKGLQAAERQLNNEAFTAKAPAPIVDGLRKQAAETKTLYDKTKSALEALGC